MSTPYFLQFILYLPVRIRIRIRIQIYKIAEYGSNLDPDPQSCFQQKRNQGIRIFLSILSGERFYPQRLVPCLWCVTWWRRSQWDESDFPHPSGWERDDQTRQRPTDPLTSLCSPNITWNIGMNLITYKDNILEQVYEHRALSQSADSSGRNFITNAEFQGRI